MNHSPAFNWEAEYSKVKGSLSTFLIFAKDIVLLLSISLGSDIHRYIYGYSSGVHNFPSITLTFFTSVKTFPLPAFSEYIFSQIFSVQDKESSSVSKNAPV